MKSTVLINPQLMSNDSQSSSKKKSTKGDSAQGWYVREHSQQISHLYNQLDKTGELDIIQDTQRHTHASMHVHTLTHAHTQTQTHRHRHTPTSPEFLQFPCYFHAALQYQIIPNRSPEDQVTMPNRLLFRS